MRKYSGMQRMLFSFYLILATYVIIVAGMYLMQRRYLYLPDTHLLAPANYGLNDFLTIRLTAADGTRLMGWYHPAKANMPTLLYFHGNAGNLNMRALRYQHFAEAGLGVVALSYRGYGGSAGSPSEQGLYQDARAALQYATQTLALKPSQLIYFGESLGSGVAVQLASEIAPGLLALEAPYTSVAARAQEIYPLLPVKWMLRDRFDSLSKIKKVQAPLLLLHGELDQVIPVTHGRAMLAAANEPKKGIFYPHILHVDLPALDVTNVVIDYAREIGLIK